MRRIETKEIRERRKKRNTMIMSLFILVILVLGTVGFAFSFNVNSEDGFGNQETVGEEVQNLGGGLWSLIFEGETLYFRNPPQSVSNIDVDIQVTLDDYVGESVYVVSDDEDVRSVMGSNFRGFSFKVQRACFGECEDDLPEKDCTENLIVHEESANNVVFQQDNCVFIEGDSRAVDAFLYKLFGVI